VSDSRWKRWAVIPAAAGGITVAAVGPAPLAVRLTGIAFLVAAAVWAFWAITDMQNRPRP
jgi:hypothetical protein